MIQPNLFGLILICILKVMTFLIFRDTLEFFYKFIWIYFELKRIKNIFLSRLYVVVDVSQAKMRRHIAVYEHATWHTHMWGAHVRADVYKCVHVCACVGALVCV